MRGVGMCAGQCADQRRAARRVGADEESRTSIRNGPLEKCCLENRTVRGDSGTRRVAERACVGRRSGNRRARALGSGCEARVTRTGRRVVPRVGVLLRRGPRTDGGGMKREARCKANARAPGCKWRPAALSCSACSADRKRLEWMQFVGILAAACSAVGCVGGGAACPAVEGTSRCSVTEGAWTDGGPGAVRARGAAGRAVLSEDVGWDRV